MPIPDPYPVSLAPAQKLLDELVERVHQGEPAAIEELRGLIAKGIRFFLARELGEEDLEERLDLTFRVVVQTLQRGAPGGSDGLMGHVLDAIRAQVTAHGARTPERDARRQPGALFQRQLESMRGVLRTLSPEDREILRRFYLEEQTERQICAQMELTPLQFRLLKARAAARFVSAVAAERGDASSKSA